MLVSAAAVVMVAVFIRFFTIGSFDFYLGFDTSTLLSISLNCYWGCEVLSCCDFCRLQHAFVEYEIDYLSEAGAGF